MKKFVWLFIPVLLLLVGCAFLRTENESATISVNVKTHEINEAMPAASVRFTVRNADSREYADAERIAQYMSMVIR